MISVILVVVSLVIGVERQDKPLPHLVHLPGILGPAPIDVRFCEGIIEGGGAGSYEIFDWVGERQGLAALGGYAENRRQAERLAEHLRLCHVAQPGRPIIISAHSGGTGPAVWAVEQLHAEAEDGPVPIVGMILIASALSPQYGLTDALCHVAQSVLTINSDEDGFILGAGTVVFGTIDRQQTQAAGRSGFVRYDVPAYDKLWELPYDPAFSRFGNDGSHIGPMRRAFSREVVAPILREWAGLDVAEDRFRATTRPATRPAEGG